MKHPKPFLKHTSRDHNDTHFGITSCAGFELSIWREKRLIQVMMSWLPHFALRPHEMADLDGEAFEQIKLAASRLFKSEVKKVEKRGELGELLLFISCIEFYKTIPFLCRVFHKHRTNDAVTGFDSALFAIIDDEVELWMGEAKLYTNRDDAITKAITSVAKSIDAGVLSEEKILIAPKIENSSPSFDKLKWLFDQNTPLDEIYDRLVIPILIAANSDALQNYNNSNEYEAQLASEFATLKEKIFKSGKVKDVEIRLIYVPLIEKDSFVKNFVEKLKFAE